MILQIVVFLIVLSILVLVHEFGHFIVGKFSGIGILEFALGLPFTKPIFSKKLKRGMKLSLYPVLFGGFVNLLGEDQAAQEKGAQSASVGDFFYRKPVGVRIAVVVAGVVMNFFLAIFLFYIFLSASGFKVLLFKLADYSFISPHQNRVVITYVQKGSPAEKAGVLGSEVVEAVDGRPVTAMKTFQAYIKERADQPVELTLTNSDLSEVKKVTVTPRSHPPEGQGALGVGIGESTKLEYVTAGEKLTSGLSYGIDMLIYNFVVIKKIAVATFQTKDTAMLSESVAGPIGIYSVVGDIINLGGSKALIGLVNLVGLMSLSLAFMNILPFPALDGGKLFLLIIEGLTKKKLSSKAEGRVNQVGMAFLLGLIILISFNDIQKIFRR